MLHWPEETITKTTKWRRRNNKRGKHDHFSTFSVAMTHQPRYQFVLWIVVATCSSQQTHCALISTSCRCDEPQSKLLRCSDVVVDNPSQSSFWKHKITTLSRKGIIRLCGEVHSLTVLLSVHTIGLSFISWWDPTMVCCRGTMVSLAQTIHNDCQVSKIRSEDEWMWAEDIVRLASIVVHWFLS